MAVREAALKAGRRAVGDIVAVVAVEFMVADGGNDLILQVIVGLPGEVRREAGGQGVVGQAFHVVARPDVAEDALGDFRSLQCFDHAACFRAAGGTVVAGRLVGVRLVVDAAVVQAVIEDAVAVGGLVRLRVTILIVNRRHFHTLCNVYDVLADGTVVAHILPVPGLLVEDGTQFQQPIAGLRVSGIVNAVVQPVHHVEIIAAARVRPVAQRPAGQLTELEAEVFLQEGEHALVGRAEMGGCLIIIAQAHQCGHAGPPAVLAAGRAKVAGFHLAAENGLHPLLGFFLQRFVVQLIGQRDQAAEEIDAFFPVVTLGVVEPAAGFVVVVIELFHIAGQVVLLQQQLVFQPAARLNRAQRQLNQRVFPQFTLICRVVLISGCGGGCLRCRRQRHTAQHGNRQDTGGGPFPKEASLFHVHTPLFLAVKPPYCLVSV